MTRRRLPARRQAPPGGTRGTGGTGRAEAARVPGTRPLARRHRALPSGGARVRRGRDHRGDRDHHAHHARPPGLLDWRRRLAGPPPPRRHHHADPAPPAPPALPAPPPPTAPSLPSLPSPPSSAASALTPILLRRGPGGIRPCGGGLNGGRTRRDQLDARLEVRVHLHHADLLNLRGRGAMSPAGAAAEPGAPRRDASARRRLRRAHRRRRRRGRHRRGGRLLPIPRAPPPRAPPRARGAGPARPPPPTATAKASSSASGRSIISAAPPRRVRPSSDRRRDPPLCDRSSLSRGASTPGKAGCAAAPGTPAPSAISYCPLSSLVRWMRPLWAASTTNFEKRENPASFSSKVGSISCMTCFKRSERMTSLCAVICFTASTTSSQGSRRTYVRSLSLVKPPSSLYEEYSSQF